jgi:ABC-2 type transport system permease protein
MKVNMPHYAVFMFIGLLSWNMFATGVQSSSSVIIRQSSLVKKIYFPRQILPLSVVGGAVINYFLSLVILFPTLLFSGFEPNWNWLYLPLIIISETLLIAGFSLFFSTANVFLRDIEHMLGIVMMLWFYMTPVVYSLQMIPHKYIPLFKLNPIADIVISFQSVLYYNQQPHWKLLIWGIFISLSVLMIGWMVFSRFSKRFAEEV